MNQFNTDKYAHGFINFYDSTFESLKNVKNILEIGIHNGASLEYFSDKFKDATIYGIDIEDKKHCETDKIKTFICDQENVQDLEKFIEHNDVEFDIILDDGGHTMRQQQVSFGILFKRVKNGGIYILEDLHTSRLEPWISRTDLITSLDMLNNFKYTGNIISNHISENDRKYLEEKIESVTIWSRNQDYNQSVTSIIKKKL